MRHLAYAMKVLVNEDLKAKDRRGLRRAAKRSESATAGTEAVTAQQPAARPATPQPAARTSGTPRPAANARA
jgi:hypothetical protein